MTVFKWTLVPVGGSEDRNKGFEILEVGTGISRQDPHSSHEINLVFRQCECFCFYKVKLHFFIFSPLETV